MAPHVPPPPSIVTTTSYSSVAPTTPGRKHGGDFEKWFLDFSNTYNLNLRLPPRASPAKRKKMADSDPEFSFELSLYNRLRFHYFSDTSDRIEELFLEAAKDVHKQWIRKPFGESDTIPSPTRLPRAASEPERCDLIRRLSQILEEWGPLKTPSFLGSRYTITPQHHSPPSSPSVDRQLQRFKRFSGDHRITSPSLSSKRPRSVAPSLSQQDEQTEEEEEDGVADMESVHSIRRTIFTKPPPPSQASRRSRSRSRNGLYQLGDSTNTSRSTFVSKVFDEAEGDPPIASQQTQTTIEASTQEKMRRPPPSSDSYSSFAPSSSTEMALHTSFANYEQTQARPAPSNLSQERRAPGPAPGSSDSFSDFSIPIETVAAFDRPPAEPTEPSVIPATPSPPRSPVRLSVQPASVPPKTPKSGKMSLEDRLQDVWRR